MVSPELSHFQSPQKRTSFRRSSSLIADGFLFVCGASLALSLIWALLSFINPTATPNEVVQSFNSRPHTEPTEFSTFYDDPSLSYSIGNDNPIKNWDEKRQQWMRHHYQDQYQYQSQNSKPRILLVTGSQPSVCGNPVGDHLLLRLFKNKVDYCRIHGVEIFYNNVLLHTKMFGFWAKYPVVKAAMLAHPEAEWIWWVDSDALFTDMEFKLPLERYSKHNLVIHGWSHAIYKEQSWTGLNAGVFLIRNCQWSMDLIEEWASIGPQSPEYEKWGKTQKLFFKDKLYPESDDQSGLIYLLLMEKGKWGDKIYLESEYNFEGYWLGMVDGLDNITKGYIEIEKNVGVLRRRHAEKVGAYYGEIREKYINDVKKRPFVVHFTGCEPCTGDHNPVYTWDACWNGMQRALNFADNQVLRSLGFVHPDLLNSSLVSPLPFDFPLGG